MRQTTRPKLALLALLTLFAPLAFSSPAAAGCGDSSDSGSDSSNTDAEPWDASGSGSSSRRSPGFLEGHEGCREVSYTLGESRCRRFGDGWDNGRWPAFRLTVAPALSRLTLGGLGVGGAVVHDDRRFQVRTDGTHLDDSDVLAGGVNVRVDLGFLDYLSIGVEVGFVGADVSGPTRHETHLAITPSHLLVPSFGAVAGLAIPIETLTVRLEVYAGLRVIALANTTVSGDCVETMYATSVEGVIEPRAAVELFLSPHVGVGAMVGTNVLMPGELHGALTMSFHAQAYDGQPR